MAKTLLRSMVRECKHDSKKKRMMYEYEGKKEEYEVCPECEYILNELTSLKEDIAKLKN